MGEENNNTTDSTGNEDNAQVSFVNADGSFGDLATAPEGVAAFISKKGFKDMEAMTSSHVELESMVGQRDKVIIIPDEGDTDGWNKFADKLGRPESAEKYAFAAKDGDLAVDDTLLGLFKEYAYKEGMSQKAFENTVRFQMDAAIAHETVLADMQVKATEEAQKAIRERYNSEDEYNEFTKKALGFAEAFKLDENRSVADVIEDKGLAHDPDVLDMLGHLADSISEDSLPVGGTKTPLNKDTKLKEIQANPAFTDAGHPNHYKLMDEFWAIFNGPTKLTEG